MTSVLRPLSSPPTAIASPLGKSHRSGVFPCDASTLTTLYPYATRPGAWVAYGAPRPLQLLRDSLRRLTNKDPEWSCYLTARGMQIAVAHIGSLRVSAEALTSEAAIDALKTLVLGLEAQRKAFTNA